MALELSRESDHLGRSHRDRLRHLDCLLAGSFDAFATPRGIHEREVGQRVELDQFLGMQPQRVGTVVRDCGAGPRGVGPASNLLQQRRSHGDDSSRSRPTGRSRLRGSQRVEEARDPPLRFHRSLLYAG
jgi:hypothetical protein